MANVLADAILDGGLTLIDTLATSIYLCSQDPTTYTEASSTYALANNIVAAGAAFGAPAAGSPNGRKVTSAAVTAGTVSGTGTATKWAVTTGAALYANGSLAASQAMTAGNTWSLPAFDIRIPGQ